MRACILVAGLLATCGIDGASAAPINFAYGFTAAGFQVAGTGTAPVDPVRGSFSFTFDPAKPDPSAISGLTVTGLNIVSDGGPEAGFTGVFNLIVIATTVIFPGGHTVAGVIDPAANDFALFLDLYPSFHPGSFYYSQADGASYSTQDVVLTPTDVPEPSSFALLCGVLSGLCIVQRRRMGAQLARLRRSCAMATIRLRFSRVSGRGHQRTKPWRRPRSVVSSRRGPSGHTAAASPR